MIVDIEIIKQDEELKDKLKNMPDDKLKRKLKAVEKAIRKYTNNNFTEPRIRFYGDIKYSKVNVSALPYLKKKDNIQLSHSLNDGVYTIEEIDENSIVLDCESLFECKSIMITKVVYPEDVQEGVINMLKWDFGLRNKVGIKSETLSRHSVTYFDMDKNNSLYGYPVALFRVFRRICEGEVLI